MKQKPSGGSQAPVLVQLLQCKILCALSLSFELVIMLSCYKVTDSTKHPDLAGCHGLDSQAWQSMTRWVSRGEVKVKGPGSHTFRNMYHL